MDILLLTLLGVAFTPSRDDSGEEFPVPEMVYRFESNKDPKKWVAQVLDNSKNSSLLELVPEGDSIEDWREMVAHQIMFTKAPFRLQVDFWRAGLLRADPKAEYKEELKADGSILVTYTSLAAQEFAIRRFFEAKDGVYMIAYHVRPAFKDVTRVKMWREMIEGVSLVPNPEKQ